MIPVDKEPEDRPMSDEIYNICVLRATVEHARDSAYSIKQIYASKGQKDMAEIITRARRHLTAAADILDEAYAKQKENEECTP